MAFIAEQAETYFSVPICKVEETPEGVKVYGKPATDSVDLDGQIADKDWLKKALPDWYHSFANIREMHQASAVGVGKKLEWDKDDEPYLTALVVDPAAQAKVKSGVYKAFSFGAKNPEIRPDKAAKKGRIVGGKIVEVSLVDYPANPDCKFEIAKSVMPNDWLDCQTGMILSNPNAPKMEPIDAPGIIVLDAQEDHIIARMGDEICKVAVSIDNGKTVFGEVTSLSDIEKRKFDPDVGGGVDRDKIPAEDFAGPDRSFPIVTPKDVADAASSLGRSKHDQGAIKAKIIAIAHRKGADFVAQLPDSWQDKKTDKEANTVSEGLLADIKKAAEEKVFCPKCKTLKDMKDGKDHVIGKAAMTVGKCVTCGSELRKAKVEKAADPIPDKPTGAEAAELSILQQLENLVAAGRANEDSEAKGTPQAEEKENQMIAKIKELAAKWEGIQHKEAAQGTDGPLPVEECADGKCGKCAKCLAAGKTFGLDSGMQPKDLAGAKSATPDLAEIIKAAVADALKGIIPAPDPAKERKEKIEKFGVRVAELKDLLTKADFGNVGGPESSTDPGSGPITVQFREIMNDMNALASEIVKDYGNGQFGLGGTTQPGAVDMGQASQIKPVETWNLQGKDVMPDLVKAIGESMQVVSAETVKSIAAQLAETLEPLRQRLETVEHSTKPASGPVILTEAERTHALNGDTTKAAVSERLIAERIAQDIPNPNDREKALAIVLEVIRGGR